MTNMSEPARIRFADLGDARGFRADPRYRVQTAEDVRNAPAEPAHDALAHAFDEGLAEGLRQAHAEAETLAQAEHAARTALSLSFARIDRQLEEELRIRLRDTVSALCETAIAPLALDPDGLALRIEKAVAMLSRADDDRIIRLNPADLPLVSDHLRADWQVEPDPALERGALRVETATGGVEDGPATWRRAIAEALARC